MFAKDHLQPMEIFDEDSMYIIWWTEVWNIWAEKIHPQPESKELQIFLDLIDENWCERLFEKNYTPQQAVNIIRRGKNIFYKL